MTIPNRIVLSRKGFDSTARYGAKPSPIFGGKRLLSLPIPEDKKKTIRYSDLRDPSGNFHDLGEIVEQLTNGKFDGNCFAHLDPDLRRESLNARLPGWRPIFGQVDQAQTHLHNQGVCNGDLFLFYGLYRNVTVGSGKIEYIPGQHQKHIVWGWMTVGDVLKVHSDTDDPEWARYHPHFTDQRASNNTVYVAAESTFETLPGAGAFDVYSAELCLTDQSQENVSLWKLPRWCAPRNGQYPLTYHPGEKSWIIRNDCVLLRTKSPAQEFVLHTDRYPEGVEWAKQLIERGIERAIGT
jgi:hypothetical protein